MLVLESGPVMATRRCSLPKSALGILDPADRSPCRFGLDRIRPVGQAAEIPTHRARQYAGLVRHHVRRMAGSPADDTCSAEAIRRLRGRSRVPANGFRIVRQLLPKRMGGRGRTEAIYE